LVLRAKLVAIFVAIFVDVWAGNCSAMTAHPVSGTPFRVIHHLQPDWNSMNGSFARYDSSYPSPLSLARPLLALWPGGDTLTLSCFFFCFCVVSSLYRLL
jgi:hypothetical protein